MFIDLFKPVASMTNTSCNPDLPWPRQVVYKWFQNEQPRRPEGLPAETSVQAGIPSML
jgi:hypothetical protein